MIADLIYKIYHFIESIKESGIFELQTINKLLRNNSEYGLDNLRKINRLYNGKILTNVLNTNSVSIEMQEITDSLHIEMKDLSSNRFEKYLDAQNIAIENNHIIETNENYAKCYSLYKKLVALNCNKFFDKDRMTYLYREYILVILTYILKKNNYNTVEKAETIYVKDANGYDFKNLEFNNEGKAKLTKVTTELLEKPMAIFFNNDLQSAPTVKAVLNDGKGVITGVDASEAKKMVDLLNAGALPVPAKSLKKKQENQRKEFKSLKE